MLLCVPNYNYLSILYNALNLPPIGTVTRVENVEVQTQHETLHFVTFRRNESKQGRIDKARRMVNVQKVLILDTAYNDDLRDDEYQITNVDDLETVMEVELSDRCRNRMERDYYGVRDDVGVGLRILGLIMQRAQPMQPAQPVASSRVLGEQPAAPVAHKRVKSEQCVICLSSPPTVTTNCGHECMCDACATEWLDKSPKCPVCKNQVLDLIKNE